MSSKAYSAHLTPEPWLRIVVIISGRLLFAAGLALILTLELSVTIRAAGSLLWLIVGKLELRRVQSGFDDCMAVRVHADGRIEVLNANREWQSCKLLSGSIVLRNLAWLRLQPSSGPALAEPFHGNVRHDHDWRRLQVIWRHIGA